MFRRSWSIAGLGKNCESWNFISRAPVLEQATSSMLSLFFVSVILGAKRRSDTLLLRLDEPIRAMFGWKKNE
jgi:hypothetical protein